MVLAAALVLAMAGCGSQVDPPPDEFSTAAPDLPDPIEAVPDSGIDPPDHCEFWGILVNRDALSLITLLLSNRRGVDIATFGPQVSVEGTTLVHLPEVTAAQLLTLIDAVGPALRYDSEGLGDDQKLLVALAALGVSPNYKLDTAQVSPKPRVNGGPGSAPVQIDPPPGAPGSLTLGDKNVLVIDTGYVPATTTVLNPVVKGDADVKVHNPQLDAPFAGHGSFIAGVLTLNSPRKYAAVEVANLWGSKPDENAYDSDFLRLGPVASGTAYDAVNLSLGSYACTLADLRSTDPQTSGDPADYMQPIAQRIALETLVAANHDVVMAAAAGNDHTEQPMFPAAFFTAPTPLKSQLTYVSGNGDPALDAAEEAAFLAWQGAVPDATDLTTYVHSIGAVPVAGDDYSNFGGWVEHKDVQGCHNSLMPTGEWTPPPGSAVTPYPLNTGWAWWCGTSFATPYWLTQNL